ncbi:MAG TPA: ABC transporter permease [Streptosporangiaceae bacterium]|jgi:NitT/TauT family transport system permease protein
MATKTQPSVIEGLDRLELGSIPGGRDSGRKLRKAWTAVWPKLLAIALILVIWQIVHLTGWKSYVLKGPGTVLSDLWHQMHHALLWQAIGITLRRAVMGYALALIIGSVIGVLVARIPLLRAGVGSIITGLQTMPSIVWFPVGIVLFGLSTPTILFVMVLGAAPSIASGLMTGVDYTPPLLLRAGQTMGLRGFALYRYLILPASLPAYVAGMKQGWAFAWRSLMAGELLVLILGQPSLGVLLNNNQNLQDFAGVTSIMIVILTIGILVDMVFNKVDAFIRRRRGLLNPGTAA